MATPFKLKRSSVSGKRPQVSDLELGELGYNFNDGRLFARKENVGVGSTVTLLNVWTENPNGSAYYNDGNIGIGTTNSQYKLEVIGDINLTGTLYQNGIAFSGGGGASVTISDTEPVSPISGNLWYDSTLGRGFIYYNDGSSSQWVDFSPASAGLNTTGGSGESYWLSSLVGIHTLSNVGIGTTNPTSALTVVGSGTSTSQLYVTGVSTFKNNINLSTNSNINLGDSNQYYLQYNGVTGSRIYSNTTFRITSDRIILKNKADAEFMLDCTADGSVDLYYNGSKKLATTNTGVTITGTTVTGQLNASGISTFSGNTFVGSGITMYSSTGIISATTFYGNLVRSITDATNLTGGYANASQLNVSGVTTISQGRIQADASSNLRFGNLPSGSGSGRNIAIGDQVLVTLNGGQGRNIGIGELSYYDTTTGQYNIGVGVRAGQKITTGSYNVILGGYDGQTGLDIRTSSNNVVIADGEGNIRQYINSSGNVGIKTTVATEALTVSGVVSATSFYGTLNAGQLTGALPAIDGSALTGVVATGAGVEIREDGTPVGTAGTIDFGTNLNVSFGSGIATVSGASSVSEATTAYSLAGTPNIYAGITTVDYLRAGSYSDLNNAIIIGRDPAGSVSGNINASSKELQIAANGFTNGDRGNIVFYRKESFLNKSEIATLYSDTGNLSIDGSLTSNGNSDNTFIGNVKVGSAITLSNSGHINATGVITATSFYGSGANITSLPAGQLTGSLPAIDGSALLNVNATGSGIVVLDDNVNVGSARTINFGTGLDVDYSTSGIATITASGGSLQSRTTVTGVTTSIANNGIGNTNITGFKSYALMRVGLSTAGWLRLYTDSASRAADASRSVGIDPTPGSGVIAEVITTGISTTQIISPFVMGGNLDNPTDTTIYAAITNLSGSTQAITANLTILQLEA